MELRCHVCGETQAVSTADEADEDARTRSIRRAFRADHGERCGGVVSLQTPSTLEAIDAEAWTAYLADRRPPPDVTVGADGLYFRLITRDGQGYSARVCEDCWQTMPRYVDFPLGLVSPESDGAAGAVPKVRPSTVATNSPDRAGALEHIRKAVCVPCYLAAFARVYPGATVPNLSTDVIGDGPQVVQVDVEGPFVAGPKPVGAEA